MLPDLTGELRRVAGDLPSIPVQGPRRWWSGALDIEGLAIASVRAAAAAAQSVSRSPLGLSVDSALLATTFRSGMHTMIDGRHARGFAPLSGFYPTADGWIRTHANYDHHAEALRRLYDVAEADELRVILRGLPGATVEQDIVNAGGLGTVVRTPAEWRSTAPAKAVDESSWIDILPTDWGPSNSAEITFDRLKVLDLTRVLAGPTATQFLALLGADVLRIDPPHIPEEIDRHIDRNTGKRTALLDLRDSRDRATFDDLLEQADVVVSGYRPGAFKHHGIDAKQLVARRPDLVVAEISAWGTSGPYVNRRGFDSIVQAATGIAHLYRTEDGIPGAMPAQALDYATGFGLVAAVCTLLGHRSRTGLGGLARLSLAKTAHVLLDAPNLTMELSPEPAPMISRIDSPYGELELAAPPVLRDGELIEHRSAPDVYGSAPPEFRPAE